MDTYLTGTLNEKQIDETRRILQSTTIDDFFAGCDTREVSPWIDQQEIIGMKIRYYRGSHLQGWELLNTDKGYLVRRPTNAEMKWYKLVKVATNETLPPEETYPIREDFDEEPQRYVA